MRWMKVAPINLAAPSPSPSPLMHRIREVAARKHGARNAQCVHQFGASPVAMYCGAISQATLTSNSGNGLRTPSRLVT